MGHRRSTAAALLAITLVLGLLGVVSGVSVVVFPNGRDHSTTPTLVSKTEGIAVQVGPDQAKSGQALAAYLSTIAALGYHGDRVFKVTGDAVTSYDQLVEQEHVYLAAPGEPFVAPHPEPLDDSAAAATDDEVDPKFPIVVTFWNKFEAPVDVYWFDTHIYQLDSNETQAFHGLHGDLFTIKNEEADVVFEHYVESSHGHEQEFHVPGGIEIEFRNHFESEPVDIYWFDKVHAHLPPQTRLSLHANDGDEFTLVDSEGNVVAAHTLTDDDGPIQFLAIPLEVHDQLPEHEEL